MEQKSFLTMQVKYTCGCGFQSHSESAAVSHSINRAHTLTVNGVIRPPQAKPQVFTRERDH